MYALVIRQISCAFKSRRTILSTWSVDVFPPRSLWSHGFSCSHESEVAPLQLSTIFCIRSTVVRINLPDHDQPDRISVLDGLEWKAFLAKPKSESHCVTMICFSVKSRRSFTEMQDKERGLLSRRARRALGNSPILLVGLGIEVRANPETAHLLYGSDGSEGPVLPEEGERLAGELGAARYMECSVLELDEVDTVLQEVQHISHLSMTVV